MHHCFTVYLQIIWLCLLFVFIIVSLHFLLNLKAPINYIHDNETPGPLECDDQHHSSCSDISWYDNSISHDLPTTSSPFVGREGDIAKLSELMNNAHIININGAPGFGKSMLAIHVGHDMAKRGTSVRYVDVVDKFSLIQTFRSDMFTRDNDEHRHQTMGTSKDLAQTSTSTINEIILLLFNKRSDVSKLVVEELLEWSRRIKSRTVLILDNCDELIYYDASRERLIHLIKTMIENSNNQLYVILTSHQQLFILDDFETLTIKELTIPASVELLSLLAPGISSTQLEHVASLVEGCPLALKVVGKLLHKEGDRLTQIFQNELMKHPIKVLDNVCLLYTSPSPRDATLSRMPSSA